MNVADAVREFCAMLRGQVRLSERTVAGYRADLEAVLGAHLAEACGLDWAQAPLEALTLPVLAAAFGAYAASPDRRRTRGTPDVSEKSKAALARAHSALRRFFRFCVQRGWLDADPSAGLERVKPDKRLPKAMTWDDAVRLFEAAQTGPWPERDTAIVHTFLAAGIRLAELRGLTTRRYTGTAGRRELRVLGKGAKERVVPVPPLLEETLDCYATSRSRRLRERRVVDTSGALFLSVARLAPLSQRGISDVVEAVWRRAGLARDRGELAHVLRHTFATEFLREGAGNLRELQVLLGHESLATTQVYTKVADEELAAAVRAHPGARLRPRGDSAG